MSQLRNRLLIFGLVAAISITALALAMSQYRPVDRSFPANVVFDQPGTYILPGGLTHFTVKLDAQGRLVTDVQYFRRQPYRLLRWPMWYHLEQHTRVVQTRPMAPAEVPPSSPVGWFACIDSHNTIWFFNPRDGGRYCERFYETANGTGTAVCGELGGWEGIPNVFLERLPDSALATYRQAQALVAPQTLPAPDVAPRASSP